jgi:alpha-L-fucosidase
MTSRQPPPESPGPLRKRLEARPAPRWYGDAKLGVFVHWGLYSIPAFAERTDGDFTTFMAELTAGKDTKGRTPYAEWYLNALRVPGSRTSRFHERNYGKGSSYFDFARRFDSSAAEVDVDDWARFFASVGAGYVVLVARHLDGFPLWPTAVTNPRMPPGYRLSRDFVGDLTRAVRARGLRMGLYYGGGVDWTFSGRPIRTMTDLMRQQSAGAEYARYAAAQWRELIDAYHPAILWNDLGWPAEVDPHQIFAHYYDVVADGLVNDRWSRTRMPANRVVRALYLLFVSSILKVMSRIGRPLPQRPPAVHHDIETHEYVVPDVAPQSLWELTRGLGKSFGYDAQETAADTLSGTELVHLLVDVVARGGNLLVNVGPDGGGQIPEIQQRPLRELGDWLRTNGQAIYATQPWPRPATTSSSGHQVRYTRKNKTLYAIVLSDRLPDNLAIEDLALPPGSRIRTLNGDADLAWTQVGNDVLINTAQPSSGPHAQVLAISMSSAPGDLREDPPGVATGS